MSGKAVMYLWIQIRLPTIIPCVFLILAHSANDIIPESAHARLYDLRFFFSWFHTQHKVLRYFQRGKRGNPYWYLVALFIATVAAGTPLGICIIIKGINKN